MPNTLCFCVFTCAGMDIKKKDKNQRETDKTGMERVLKEPEPGHNLQIWIKDVLIKSKSTLKLLESIPGSDMGVSLEKRNQNKNYPFTHRDLTAKSNSKPKTQKHFPKIIS